MTKANDQVGPYTIVRKLGRGAFGVVWLAEKRSAITTTKVALKMPNDEDVDLEAIRQEASLWVHASGHPNVLPIIDADIYDEQIVIVSEYAPDGSLSKWLERHDGRAPSVEAAVEMVLEILSGLEHLHRRGIIHRDLKPDNILLQGETPRLADFGIARILKTTSHSTIATGTPAYMPPEAFDGKRSEQTDLWSVGVIFYQLLAGRLPFAQTDMVSLLAAIITRSPEPLPAHVPSPLREVVARSLEKEPARRYKSAAEMRQAIREAVGAPRYDSAQEKTRVLDEPQTIVDLPPTIVEAQNRNEPHGEVQPPAKESERKREEPRSTRPSSAQEPAFNYSTGEQPKSGAIKWVLVSVGGLILLTIIIAAVASNSSSNYSTSASNTTNAAASSYTASANTYPNKSSSTSSSTPLPTPTPVPKPTTVSVRVLPVWINGRGSELFAPDFSATITSSAGTSTKQLGEGKYIQFNNVPCDEEIIVKVADGNFNDPPKSYRRYIGCDKAVVDLGSFKAGSLD